MIPVPLFILGISATTLGIRHLRKKIVEFNTTDNYRKISEFLTRQGLKTRADSAFDLNAHLPNGNSLITEALIQGRNDILELLIEQKADVNAMNSEGKTALFYCKNSDQIEKLIKAGADVNARDLHGRTVLFDCKDIQLVHVLLKYGTNLLIQDKEGKTVLHTLSTADKDLTFSLIFARLYVTHTPALLNIDDNMGNKAEICDLYLKEERHLKELYCDTFSGSDILGRSPDELLYDAVQNGKYKLAKIALKQGANPNFLGASTYNWSMLELAVKNNNPEFIPLLVQYGAEVNQEINGYTNQEINGYTALNLAIKNYRPECVKTLLNCGAKINESIIRTAKYYVHPEIYSMICKNDKMPSCEDIPNDVDLKKFSQSELDQYLIHAIKAHDVENVHRLLNAGADPNVDADGKCALIFAAEKNAPEIIQALHDAGVNINKRFSSNTALSWACYYHYDRCVELLLKLGAEEDERRLKHNTCARIREIWRKYKSSSKRRR